jgi:hypothetical protein
VKVDAISATVGWNVDDALMRGFNDLWRMKRENKGWQN